MKLPAFDYHAPTSLDEATALLASIDGARPLAGGQSLLPVMAFRLAQPSALVDLNRIAGLKDITVDAAGVALGALVTWRQVGEDDRLKAACPLLAAAIPHIAHYQIRNKGTVGGSLAHADPAAELPAVAVACEAVVETVSRSGRRVRTAEELFTGPLMTCLEPDEIIASVRFPAWPADRLWAFEEFSRRRGDFALAGVAAFFDRDSQGRAVGSHFGAINASDVPIRLRAAERAFDGRAIDAEAIDAAANAASGEVTPAGDMHGDSAYRKALFGTLLRRALTRAAGLTRG